MLLLFDLDLQLRDLHSLCGGQLVVLDKHGFNNRDLLVDQIDFMGDIGNLRGIPGRLRLSTGNLVFQLFLFLGNTRHFAV